MRPRSSPAVEKRIRRTPDEAKALILDAAEAKMTAVGPAGIRLQDVATEAGVSHPTILHHFGSRAGLVRALNERTLADLKSVLLMAMQADSSTGRNVIGAAFEVYRNGLAQRLAWLVQAEIPVFEEMVASLQALRVDLAAPGVEVDEADTRAIVHLTTIAAFGDAILGSRLRRAPTPAEEQARRSTFEAWFSALINGFIGAKAHPAATPPGKNEDYG
jgi:AcrR family transcriptional regulator